MESTDVGDFGRLSSHGIFESFYESSEYYQDEQEDLDRIQANLNALTVERESFGHSTSDVVHMLRADLKPVNADTTDSSDEDISAVIEPHENDAECLLSNAQERKEQTQETASSPPRIPPRMYEKYASCLARMWDAADATKIPVRGPHYLEDSKKVKSGASMGQLLHVDAWTAQSHADRHHIALKELSREYSLIRYYRDYYPDDLIFLLNIQMPDPNNTSAVIYWRIPNLLSKTHIYEGDESGAGRVLRKFCKESTDDAYRNDRFKLVPNFVKAPWALRKFVPSRPALTGHKLTQRYYRSQNYMEVDLDVSSSGVARTVGSLCMQGAAHLQVELFLTLEGKRGNELPEQIFGAVAFSKLNVALAEPLPM